jgi:hypothetical protein
MRRLKATVFEMCGVRLMDTRTQQYVTHTAQCSNINGIALTLIVDRITELKIPLFIGVQYSTVQYSTVVFVYVA